ncbi:retropepsin-like aspartic protease family protein [Naasia aerilata]|uniref:retropepsin-like aspartic protease family protein n=1 Tax=Naasia aerilata TaxID=1162966 RepID=UPI0025732321|nr:retropepsin-like aspartic protease [Naasia aerilata]
MVTVALSYEQDDELEPESVVLVVEGFANGEPLRFVVDTGAGTSSVPNLGALRELPVSGMSAARGANATVSGDHIVVVDQLEVGELTARSVRANRSDPPRRPLLGMDVLGEHRCFFRFSSDRLELDGPIGARDEDLELVRRGNGSPGVAVDFGSTTVLALWDSGASLTVVDGEFARTHPRIVVTSGSKSSGFDSVGDQVSGTRCIVSECRIGGQLFGPSAGVVLDLGALNAVLPSPLNVIIGMPLARRADWLFDFPNDRWHVKPHPSE